MTTLLSIEEPAKKPRPAPPEWGAFTEMGFRPLYLAGCLWALFSVLLWVHAPARLTGVLGGMLVGTFLGVFLIPLFFVVVQRLAGRGRKAATTPEQQG